MNLGPDVKDKKTAQEVFQGELEASLSTDAARRRSSELGEHRLQRLNDSFIEKVNLAKEILGTDTLHPRLLIGIAIDDDDYFTRNNKRFPVTTNQLRELFDRGVIGEGSTPGYSSRESYNATKSEAPLPGIDSARNASELFIRVPQSGIQFSSDIPLVSDGFSQCHAAILYDRTLSQAALLHVMHWDADPGQVERMNHMWPHTGERELIYVYGSGSREDHSHYMAEATGAMSVRRIRVATASYHWGLVYHPGTNEISVFRKMPADVLRYPGFSSAVYDEQERMTSHREERQKQAMIHAVYQAFHSPTWSNLNGVLSDADFVSLSKMLSVFLDKEIAPDSLKAFLLKESLAFEVGDSCIVPASFSKIDDERKEELHGIYERSERFAEIRFTDYGEARDFYHKLIVRCGADLQCADMFCTLFQRQGEEVGVVGGSGNTISFRIPGDIRNTLYHDILEKAQMLQKETAYKLYFDSGLGYSSHDTIRPPHPLAIEEWEYFKERRG